MVVLTIDFLMCNFNVFFSNQSIFNCLITGASTAAVYMIGNKNEAHLKTNKNNSVELSIGSTPFDYTGT